MCHHLTLLAQHSKRHYIAQCEHGTISLVWMNTTLHMDATGLIRLAAFLEDWSPDDLDCMLAYTSDLRLDEADLGRMHLWFCGTGLQLMPVEVQILTAMTSCAARQLTSLPVEVTQPASLLQDETVTVMSAGTLHTAPTMEYTDAGHCQELIPLGASSVSLN
jgi:hypothetical protein